MCVAWDRSGGNDDIKTDFSLAVSYPAAAPATMNTVVNVCMGVLLAVGYFRFIGKNKDASGDVHELRLHIFRIFYPFPLQFTYGLH